MHLKTPATENERLLASILLIFIVFFGLSSLIALIAQNENSLFIRYSMTLSFIIGMGAGIAFYLMAAPQDSKEITPDRLSILERALNDGEITMLEIIRGSDGITQDSLRFRTGFSKSKVSALLLNLEKKGIITREKVGRTYSVYIGKWLK